MLWKGLPKTARIGVFVLVLGLPFALLGDAVSPRARATPLRSAPPEKARLLPSVPPIPAAAWPVPRWIRLGSGYGLREGRRTKRPTFHAGADFPAPEGTPVFAARAGRVVRVVADSEAATGFRGYGNAVLIFHPQDDCWSLYAHLREAKAREGAQVVAGAPIGSVGKTNNGRFGKMGAHLHLEVRRRTEDGAAPFPGPYRVNNVDPTRWLAARGVVVGPNGVSPPFMR